MKEKGVLYPIVKKRNNPLIGRVVSIEKRKQSHSFIPIEERIYAIFIKTSRLVNIARKIKRITTCKNCKNFADDNESKESGNYSFVAKYFL